MARFPIAPPAVELAPANATAGQSRSLGLRVRYRMDATRLYLFVFGALTIAGGIMGYAKAGSTASIIAGSISGILLLMGAWLMPTNQVAGLAVSLVVSLLLLIYFASKFMRTSAFMPAGLMSILSVIGIVMVIVAWLKK